LPLVAAVAASLCRLIEETADPRRIPLALIDQHVDAVRAIMREHSRPLADAVAGELTTRLRAVTDEFLRDQGPDGGDRRSKGPPLVPDQ